MALEEYRRKRKPGVTPEPDAEVKSSPEGNHFVVQKHRARQLHYDFRLELDGVLKSWAVPKGPSLDPDEKRLAMHVEDHPLDYAGFEGVIPKGEYGGGTVMVWDEGHWYPLEDSAADPRKAYESGALKFRLEGSKLRGGWMLVRMKPRPDEEDKEAWLLFKERDGEARAGGEADVGARLPDSAKSGRSLEEIAAEADRVWSSDGPVKGELTVDPAAIEGARRGSLPEWVEPELATLVAEPPRGEEWLHEIKFDGYRVMCRLEHGRARLFTRRGADWTDHFPTLRQPVEQVAADTALLDGEVVYVKDDGRTSFLELASALQGGTDPESRIVYNVFDLLHLDGYDLTRAPLRARKEALRRLLARSPHARIRYVEHVEGSGEEFFRQSCELALEGSIAKRADAPYRPGRGRDWLKVKCMRRQEFVVGGFTERANTTGGVGALLVGFHEERDGPLRFGGRVGTGWDEATMRELRERFEELVQAEPPFVNPPKGREARDVIWVKPELVVEVEYLSWNRQRGMLRHPSFEGLRLDKPAAEVVLETSSSDRPRAGEPAAIEGRTTKAPAADPPAAEAPATEAPATEAPATEAPRAARRRTVASRAASRKGDDPAVVGGVTISHPDRVVYPDVGLTKLDVARYYEEVGASILPYVARRPLTLVRCPQDYAGQCFFQKHAADGFPESIIRVPIKENGGTADYIAVDSLGGLLALVQFGALEFHVWGARLEDLDHPDQMVFDLDPAEDLPFAAVVDAARILRGLLRGLGLESFVKTSGGKGLHLVVPLAPTRTWDEVKDFSHALVDAMVAAEPAHFVATMALKKRPGKVFIDYLRNGRGATFVAPYSTRRRAGAPLSLPLRWDELGPSSRGDQYSLLNVHRRMASIKADPWEAYERTRQELTDWMLASAGVKEKRGAA